MNERIFNILQRLKIDKMKVFVIRKFSYKISENTECKLYKVICLLCNKLNIFKEKRHTYIYKLK